MDPARPIVHSRAAIAEDDVQARMPANVEQVSFPDAADPAVQGGRVLRLAQDKDAARLAEGVVDCDQHAGVEALVGPDDGASPLEDRTAQTEQVVCPFLLPAVL